MMLEGYETIEFTRSGRVLTVTLAGDGPVNAVTERMHFELARVFRELQDDPDSDIIVLTGKGKCFCAGGDMAWFQKMIDDPALFRDAAVEGRRITNDLLALEKPIICRLNGAAAGLGASMALMCDVIIANETAMIGDPHVKVGLVAADGGAIIWPQLVGFARAKEMLLTGDMLSAAEAKVLGLINHAVPADALDDKVQEIVGKIAANPRWAVRWTKASVNLVLRDLANRINDTAFAYEVMTNMTRDRQEAVSAFVERRSPGFTGE